MENTKILKGFCQKCKWPIEFLNEGPSHNNSEEYGINDPAIGFLHEVDPLWFLSAKQMEIVFHSEEYDKWIDKFVDAPGYAQMLFIILEKEPFLVAKILRDSFRSESIREEKT